MMSPKDAEPSDTELVRALADILVDTGLTEIEIDRGGLKIRVVKQAQAAPAQVFAAPSAAYAPPPPPPDLAAASPGPSTGSTFAGELVKSPMVGTVYLQPQPGAPLFVNKGDVVAAGQTLLLIEAMKTMNPITAPKAGKVVDILIGDAQPVEFGEPLIVIG